MKRFIFVVITAILVAVSSSGCTAIGAAAGAAYGAKHGGAAGAAAGAVAGGFMGYQIDREVTRDLQNRPQVYRPGYRGENYYRDRSRDHLYRDYGPPPPQRWRHHHRRHGEWDGARGTGDSYDERTIRCQWEYKNDAYGRQTRQKFCLIERRVLVEEWTPGAICQWEDTQMSTEQVKACYGVTRLWVPENDEWDGARQDYDRDDRDREDCSYTREGTLREGDYGDTRYRCSGRTTRLPAQVPPPRY